MSVSIFKTPSIFIRIEIHLHWLDFIHLMCTCRELYFNWVSADKKRWKNLGVPLEICNFVLGINVSPKKNPILVMRKRAVSALTMNAKPGVYSPCMGGCGQHVLPKFFVSKKLPYAVCFKCAKQSYSHGSYLIERYLNTLGLTFKQQDIAYQCAHSRFDSITWFNKCNIIMDCWNEYYAKKLKTIPGWKVPVFEIASIHRLMKRMLKENAF
jgi:hypothetical protein